MWMKPALGCRLSKSLRETKKDEGQQIEQFGRWGCNNKVPISWNLLNSTEVPGCWLKPTFRIPGKSFGGFFGLKIGSGGLEPVWFLKSFLKEVLYYGGSFVIFWHPLWTSLCDQKQVMNHEVSGVTPSAHQTMSLRAWFFFDQGKQSLLFFRSWLRHLRKV